MQQEGDGQVSSWSPSSGTPDPWLGSYTPLMQCTCTTLQVTIKSYNKLENKDLKCTRHCKTLKKCTFYYSPLIWKERWKCPWYTTCMYMYTLIDKIGETSGWHYIYTCISTLYMHMYIIHVWNYMYMLFSFSDPD